MSSGPLKFWLLEVESRKELQIAIGPTSLVDRFSFQRIDAKEGLYLPPKERPLAAYDVAQDFARIGPSVSRLFILKDTLVHLFVPTRGFVN